MTKQSNSIRQTMQLSDDANKHAANRLREARKNARYKTAKVAATALGFNYATFKAHESGGRGYKYDNAEAYARAFSVSPGWLCFGEETEAHILKLENMKLKNTIKRLAAKLCSIRALAASPPE